MTNIFSQIADHPTYKQVLADSFGGIMYDVANYGAYDADEVLSLWGELTPAEQEAAGGIMQGAINFLQGK